MTIKTACCSFITMQWITNWRNPDKIVPSLSWYAVENNGEHICTILQQWIQTNCCFHEGVTTIVLDEWQILFHLDLTNTSYVYSSAGENRTPLSCWMICCKDVQAVWLFDWSDWVFWEAASLFRKCLLLSYALLFPKYKHSSYYSTKFMILKHVFFVFFSFFFCFFFGCFFFRGSRGQLDMVWRGGERCSIEHA